MSTENSNSKYRVRSDVRYANAGGYDFDRVLSTRDKRFLKRAANMAKKREVDFHNHCTIITKGPKVVAIGYNSYKNDPRHLSDEHVRGVPGRNLRHGVGPHSEISALQQVSDPTGVTVYVVRVMKNGELAESKPCEVCTEALQEAGVKRVVWSEDGLVL